MPNEIYKKEDGKYGVRNKVTGRVHAKNTTKEKAAAQERLLRGIEHGMKPTGEPAKTKKKKKKANPGKHKDSKVPAGHHRMPSGHIMSDAEMREAHKTAQGFMR